MKAAYQYCFFVVAMVAAFAVLAAAVLARDRHNKEMRAQTLYHQVTDSCGYITSSACEARAKQAAEVIVRECRDVLQRNPRDQECVKKSAVAYYRLEQLDEAEKYFKTATRITPKDAEPFYMLGVIDWTFAHRLAAERKTAIGLKIDQPFGTRKQDRQTCAVVRELNSLRIADGLGMLTGALDLRPDHVEAQTYMGLLYREKADTECDNPQARAADVAMAQRWGQQIKVDKR